MKQILKDGLKDSPLLLKDSTSLRVSAQGVRTKETPKIPKNHEEMNLEKENSCFVTKENWHLFLKFMNFFHRNYQFFKRKKKSYHMKRSNAV